MTINEEVALVDEIHKVESELEKIYSIITSIVINADSCKDNKEDFATMNINGKEYLLTTKEQIKLIAGEK